MGDFNAKIGQTNPNETATGKHGYGDRNCRGNRLIDFAHENNLAIINTFFKKKNKQRWTWRSPNGIIKNELDYILTNLHRNIYNIQVLNITYPSDHRPVRAANILPRPKSRSKFGQCLRYQLNNEEKTQTYKRTLNSCLTNLLESWRDEDTVQKRYDDITNAIDTSLKRTHEVSSSTNQGKNRALSTRTKSLICRRQELQKIKPKSRAMKNVLKALYKLISKRIHLDYKAHRTRTIEKHLNTTNSIKKAYRELRTHKLWIEELKDKTKKTQNRTEILKIATEYYKKLYSAPNQHPYEFINGVEARAIIDESEVIKGIKSLKMEKSPGPNRITNDVIKTSCAYIVKPLTLLFNLILNSSYTPHQWSESEIILLYK